MEVFKCAWIVIGISLILILEVVSIVQHTIGNHDQEDVLAERIKRSVTGRDNCSSWSEWVNKNTPTASSKMDREYMTPSDVNAFCPTSVGGKITNMTCVEGLGGQYTGSHQDTDHQFMFRCDNITEGGICTPQNDHTDPCPDVAVKFFCFCAKPAPLGNIPSALSTSSLFVTTPSPLPTPPLPPGTTPTTHTTPSTPLRTPPLPPETTPTTHVTPSTQPLTPPFLLGATPSTHVTPPSQHSAAGSLIRTTLSLAGDKPVVDSAMSSSVVDNESDASSSEENDDINDDLPDVILLYHTVPTVCALGLVIMLCCIISVMLCKMQKPSINPLPEKPMGTGHLF